jgi:TPP-dependent pyruvate/acetoin dehydrogenase alpha subunit
MTLEISKKVLDEFGCYTQYSKPKDISVEKQLDMYYQINLIREFDTKVRDLWMENRIYGLAHAYVGSEAIAVGACNALKPEDCITSTHRGHGHTIAKGGDVKIMMAELFGKYEGYNHGKGGSMHIADVEHGMLGATGIVGSGMPLAVGAAMASDRLNKGFVSLCFHGDGGSNQGVWHESINMAAAWKLPVIFVCENNQYAIATSIKTVSGQPNIYKRAAAYDIPGVLVDGFNCFAVYEAVKEAAERARKKEGPTLIEARTIRMLGHFVADDQWYRDLKAVEPWWNLEPIRRMRAYLLENKIADEKGLKEIEDRSLKDIADAITYAEQECSEPSEEMLYADVYANGEIIK